MAVLSFPNATSPMTRLISVVKYAMTRLIPWYSEADERAEDLRVALLVAESRALRDRLVRQIRQDAIDATIRLRGVH